MSSPKPVDLPEVYGQNILGDLITFVTAMEDARDEARLRYEFDQRTIGTKCRRYRMFHQVTQIDVGHEMGRNPQRIVELEVGRVGRWDLETVKKFIAAVDKLAKNKRTRKFAVPKMI